MDAPGGAAVARNQDLVADAFLAMAVGAAAGLRARRFAEEALLILRCSDRSGTAHGFVERIDDLVHPGNDDHLARAEYNGSDPVAAPVNVHKLAGQADGIRARQEEIGREAVVGRLLPLGIRLHALAVDDAPRAVPQNVRRPSRRGHRAESAAAQQPAQKPDPGSSMHQNAGREDSSAGAARAFHKTAKQVPSI